MAEEEENISPSEDCRECEEATLVDLVKHRTEDVGHLRKRISDDNCELVEVICTSSGKTRRFVPGVKAGYALSIINQKLGSGNPFAIYIEAAKEGEEPIVFAPDSLLRSCGDGWKLHTVVESQVFAGHNKGAGGQGMKGRPGRPSDPPISSAYIGKIIMAFVFIFVLGAVFTLALESLPRLIAFITSAYHILYSE